MEATVQDIPYLFEGRLANEQFTLRGTYIDRFLIDLGTTPRFSVATRDFPVPFGDTVSRVDLNLRGTRGRNSRLECVAGEQPHRQPSLRRRRQQPDTYRSGRQSRCGALLPGFRGRYLTGGGERFFFSPPDFSRKRRFRFGEKAGSS